MVDYVTWECGFLDLIIINKDEVEVTEIILMEHANAISASIILKNMLASHS